MKFNIVFVKIILGIILVCQTALALTVQEREQEMLKDLATYPLVASAVSTLTQASLENEIDNATAINAMKEFSDYKSPLFSNIVDNHIKYSDILFLQEQVDTINNSNKIANYDNFKTLVSAIDNSEIVSLSPISLATNSYDFVQNFSKAYSSDGYSNVRLEGGLAATNNLIGVYIETTKIATTIANYTPKSTVTKYLANNAFSKGLKAGASKVASGSIMTGVLARSLGWITVGAEIEAAIYMHKRDGYLNDIKENIFSSHRVNMEFRSLKIKQLIELYLEKEKSKQYITKEDIRILFQYAGNVSVTNKNTNQEIVYNLNEEFILYSNNHYYLQNNYEKDTFLELNNDEKIHVAIDALVFMSVKEDGKVKSYLDEKITSGASAADIIFGSIKGSAIYEIYDVKSLKEKMFLYYDTEWSSVEYYQFIYRIAFNSEVAKFKSEQLAELGREIERMKKAQFKYYKQRELSRLLAISDSSDGDIISVSFGKDVEYKDEIKKASVLGKSYKFIYKIDDQVRKVLYATYNIISGSLVFETPSTEPYSLIEVMIPQAPRWDGDTQERFLTFSLPVGNNGISYENINNGIVGSIIENIDLLYGPTSVEIVGNYAYFADWNGGMKIVDISNPSSPKVIGSTGQEYHLFSNIAISGNYAYIDRKNYLDIIDISNPSSPFVVKSMHLDGFYEFSLVGNTVYILDSNGLTIVDISTPSNPSILSSLEMKDISGEISVNGNYLYIIDNDHPSIYIINISNPYSPIISSTENDFSPSGMALDADILGNHLFILYYNMDSDGSILDIIDISNPSSIALVSSTKMPDVYSQQLYISENYIYFTFGDVIIMDISNLSFPILIGPKQKIDSTRIAVSGEYIYVPSYRGLRIYNKQVILGNNQISLVDENSKDGRLHTNIFTKSWIFSRDISNYEVEIISNSYENQISSSSFTKNGNTISISLTPNTSKTVNKLELNLTKDNEVVKIDGSDAFWSLTKTNNTPRLVDGQALQMVGGFSETIELEIASFDEDGDSVSLSIVDGDGGTISFDSENPNRLLASFSDDLAIHTIKIALSDSKESVEKEISVLRFNSETIKTFYSDVDQNSSNHYFSDIAFLTLNGVVAGQSDPNDATKRIFRPTDDVSMAEALAMVIHGADKAGLIELETHSNYLKAYPSWAMPYYTFAREQGAVDDLGGDLSIIYPTREKVAQMIVKVLGLDEKLSMFPDRNTSFSDETDFSNEAMLRYAKVSKVLGLFMTSDSAQPQLKVSRAEMANIITKIFMIPHADLVVSPEVIEYGEILSFSLENLQASTISQTDFNLVESSVSSSFAFGLNLATNSSYDSSLLKVQANNQAVALLDNNGIKNVIYVDLNISFTDSDNDGVQDSLDAFIYDERYSNDINSNLIPDILDEEYGLAGFVPTDTVNIDGNDITISLLIAEGGYFDNDKDGQLDSTDLDDDNDGMPDAYEELYGFNSLYAGDAGEDIDGDGYTNLQEYKAGSNPNDSEDTPTSVNTAVIMYLLN